MSYDRPGLLLKNEEVALDLTRYIIGLAVLMGIMALSLICAHFFFRRVLHRERQGREIAAPGAAD